LAAYPRFAADFVEAAPLLAGLTGRLEAVFIQHIVARQTRFIDGKNSTAS
jgi:hypothetical protein